jgi:ABC-type nitrate/sulfonate/bicarbonate transport system substrate-binding protein
MPMLAEPPTTPGSDPGAAGTVGSNLTRPRWGRRLAAGLAAIGVSAVFAACGSSDSGTTSTAASTTSTNSLGLSFTPTPGTDIPSVSVNFAMWPYGDTTLAAPGIDEGWFKEVGIALPNGKKTLTEKQVQQQLLNNQLDIASGYVPNTIATYATAKNLKMVQLTNSYIGNYIWASPQLSGVKSIKDFTSGDFAANFKTVINQMKGKRVALSDAGSNRDFFHTILQIGGLSTKDFASFVSVADTKIVQLAKAGKIDYAFPAGAAQSVQVSGLGFKNLGGFVDMAAGLPKGDDRVLNGIGHAGLQSTDAYVKGHRETVLRFMGVMYRIIDELQNDPQAILKYSLPTLNTAIGAKLTIQQAEDLFKNFYGTVSFDQTKELLEDPNYKLYYQMVYKSQIKAAQAGGIIPKGLEVKPDDMILHKGLYDDLVALKKAYDDLVATKHPTGALADKAAKLYAGFDYLDAYRLAKAAVAGS